MGTSKAKVYKTNITSNSDLGTDARLTTQITVIYLHLHILD